ncbi:hypothetical protein HDU76_010403, partial [Blyttiomyces sp. JEL0837]
PLTFLTTRVEDETTMELNPILTYDDFSCLTVSRMSAARDLVHDFAELDQQNRQSADGMLSEKFQYRWIGPVRVVEIHGTDSQSSIEIVKTYPGYEIVHRTIHISRLRPYTYLEPEDNAQLATLDLQPDMEKEIQQWTDARLLRRKPRGEQPMDTGINCFIMQSLYPDFTKEDIVNPEFRIDHIVIVEHTNKYECLTKWDGWTHRFNTWQRESDMHTDLISKFWDARRASQPHQYKLRQTWLRTHKTNKALLPTKGKKPQFVIEIPLTKETSAWDKPSSLVVKTVVTPKNPVHVLIHISSLHLSKIVHHGIPYKCKSSPLPPDTCRIMFQFGVMTINS